MNSVATIQPSRMPIPAAVEEWRAIDGFPGYQVSNFGNVRSFRKGELFPHMLRPSRGNKAKRALVTLYLDRKPNYRLVARLVCEAFHGVPLTDQQAAHCDGDVFNDRSDNLEWKYPLGNCEDRDAHGRTARGERHYAAKLTEAAVREIRATYAAASAEGRIYGVVIALSKKHQVTLGCIEDVVYGRKWRNVA